MTNAACTPLYDWHVAHHGRMVEFAGWRMPVQYTSIVEEHHATRRRAGLFDISHMGRLRVSGPGACSFLDGLLTRRTTDLKPGGIRYSLVTNEQGGVLDDVLVYRLRDPDDEFLLVVNASNRAKILQWIAALHSTAPQAVITDQTEQTAMIAVQGPHALELVDRLLTSEPRGHQLRYYTSAPAVLLGHSMLLSRTGYTGEDGCELIVEAAAAEAIWTRLLEAGASLGAAPAGLGARDTLRLEAGMPLYGHELREDIHPYEADLGFAVNLEGRTFPGAAALAELAHRPLRRKRVGITCEGRRVPRQGFAVYHQDQRIGEVTSGTHSPTLDRPIAMALIDPVAASVGTSVEIDIRGSRVAAHVTALPFYKRPH